MNDQNKGAYFFYHYRKLFFIAIILGGVAGVGITFLIPPKYMSTAIVYPYNSHTRENLVANPQFGFETETEQLLQLLSSKSMRDRTIEKFKLYDYYEIDTTEASWNSDLTLLYINDIQFMRSKYLSVVINVTMKDPVLAANVANYQVAEMNNYRTSIFESNRKSDFEYIKLQYELSEKDVFELRDSIYAVRKGEKALLFNFIENLNNENYDPSDFVNDAGLERLIVDYRFAYDRYISLKGNYEKLKREINEPIPSVYSIDSATPSYKKVSPSFVLNGVLGAIVLFTLVFTLRFLMDKWNDVKASFKN